jgi:hypothetical protein
MAALGRSALGCNSMRVAAGSVPKASLAGREACGTAARRPGAIVCHSTGSQHPGQPAGAGAAAAQFPSETEIRTLRCDTQQRPHSPAQG